jgi:hypothetical protein
MIFKCGNYCIGVFHGQFFRMEVWDINNRNQATLMSFSTEMVPGADQAVVAAT